MACLSHIATEEAFGEQSFGTELARIVSGAFSGRSIMGDTSVIKVQSERSPRGDCKECE
jgi:hypothetical protein